MQTLTAHLGQLKAAFQELGYTSVNTSGLSVLVDLLRTILELITKVVKNFGTLGTISLGTLTTGLVKSIKSLNTFRDQYAAIQTMLKGQSAMDFTSSFAGAEQYASALNNLNKLQQQFVMEQNGLTASQQTYITSLIQVKKSTQELSIEKIALTLAQTQNAEATEKLTQEQYQQMIAEKLGVSSTQSLTFAKLEEKLATLDLTEEQKKAVVQLYAMEQAEKSASTAALGLSASLKAMFASNPVGMILMIVSALVSLFGWLKNNTNLFETTAKKIERLEDNLSDLTDAINETADAYKDLVDAFSLNADTNLIDEFAELAKGVDFTGANVSLSNEEYERFLELQNTIVEQFPELDAGMDSNGNHMLNLSYNTDILTQSLYDLVEAALQAANIEIAGQMGDALENAISLQSVYEKQAEQTKEQISDLEEAYNWLMSLDSKDISWINFDDVAEDWASKLEILQNELGVVVTDSFDEFGISHLNIDFDTDAVYTNYQIAMNDLERKVADYNNQIASSWSAMNPIISAWLSTNYSYNELDTAFQSMVSTIAGSLDFSELGLKTEDDVEKFINDIIIKVQDAEPEVAEAFADLLNFNTDELSYSDLKGTMDKWSGIATSALGDTVTTFVNNKYTELLDLYNDKLSVLVDTYKESEDYAKDTSIGVAQQRLQKYQRWLDSLSGSDLDLLFSLDLEETGTWTLEDWQNKLEELKNNYSTLTFDFDIDAETEAIDAVRSAVSDAASSMGMTSEEVETLTERYKSLKDFDAASLFINTSNGIRINTEELKKYEKEIKETNSAKFKSELEDLADQYNDCFKELQQLTIGTDAYNSKNAELQNIQDRIEAVAQEAAQYGALTSAYNAWIDAMSNDNNRDTFENIGKNFSSMQDILNQGWYNDDSLQAYIDLLIDADKQTGDTATDFAMLTQTISGTNHSLMDYFTYDEDNNLISNGLIDFLEDVNKTLGDTYAWQDELGNWTFDFSGTKLEDVAKYFGTTEEFIQEIVLAMEDVSAAVQFEDIIDQLGLFTSGFDVLKTLASEAAEALDTDYSFNFDTTDIDDLNSQIEYAKELYYSFVDENGEINLDDEQAQNAQTLLLSLVAMKQELVAPAIMKLDTSTFDEAYQDVADAISLLQEFTELSDKIDLFKSIGEDTSDLEAQLQQVGKQIEELPDDVLLNVGLNEESQAALKESLSGITGAELSTDVHINEESVTAVIEEINGIEVEPLELMTNQEQIMDEMQTIQDFTFNNKSFSVTASGAQLVIKNLTTIQGLINSLSGTKISVSGNFATGSASALGTAFTEGTAFAEGSALAEGDWSAGESGMVLGGELGQELVVRNGRFFTVGDHGAEFFKIQPNDIVFNAQQTKELLNTGRVRSGGGRGRAYVTGSAFSSTGATGGGLTGSKSTTASTAATSSSKTSSSSSSSSSSSTAKDDEENTQKVIDWIKVAIDRVERSIDNLATIAKSSYKNLSTRLSANTSEMSAVRSEIELQTEAYTRYMQEYQSVGSSLSSDIMSKIANGTIDITSYDEDTASIISDAQNYYDAALDARDTIIQLQESLAGLYLDAFNNIQTDAENQLDTLAHLTTTYENAISDTEEKGYLVSVKYYEALSDVEKKNINIMEKELADLQKQLQESMDSGLIEEGSQAWWSHATIYLIAGNH